jgi:hypothetical protein
MILHILEVMYQKMEEHVRICKDVETRIQKARGAFTRLRKIWMAHYINKDTEIKLFNVYVKLVLLYGCQTWLVTCEIQRKLQSFVNRCLWYIMKIWWPMVISNEKVWEMTGQININKEIWKCKFGWIGHTLLKDDSELCKAALQWNPRGTRGRGRPRNWWRRTTLNESGKCSWSDLRFIARSREGWRRFVDNLCSCWNYGHYYYY